jgi:hypothetical protein
VVKAGGEKGSAFARERTITMIFQNILAKFITLKGVFAGNADPWALQPEFTLDSSSLASLSGAVERGFEMGSYIGQMTIRLYNITLK